MKPRPGPALLTDEDIEAWALVLGRFAMLSQSLRGNLLSNARRADTRDGDLMFWCQRYRSYTFPVDLPPLAWSPWEPDARIDCGGALHEWKTLNITYFA